MRPPKTWLTEQADEERHAVFRAWFRATYQRPSTDEDEAWAWEDFEKFEASHGRA